MNNVYEILVDSGFRRFSIHQSEILVVHCVPGAGKSTAIRKILEKVPIAQAFTFGVCDPPSLGTCRIKAASEWRESVGANFTIVDEYTEGDFLKFKPKIVFGDPCQSENLSAVLRPHFICNLTRRFGKNTCVILSKLGFDIASECDDVVVLSDIFKGEPEGQVIAFEREVKDLLQAHNCAFKDFCEVRGETYKCVTFVTAETGIPKVNLEKYYLCLTRHSEKLIILSPDAAFATS